MSDSHDDFVSFEKALRDLNLRSEELKKLVSEGEIRAFRDGDSMKFRTEDIDGLLPSDEDELAFEDNLEDDAGMVTEEFSDEDTLLAEDDLDDEEDEEDDVAEERAAPRRRSRTAGRIQASEEEEKAPVWLAVVGGLTAVLMLWGMLVVMSIAGEQPVDGSVFTSMFAK